MLYSLANKKEEKTTDASFAELAFITWNDASSFVPWSRGVHFYVASPNLDGERKGQGRWPCAQLADDAMTPPTASL